MKKLALTIVIILGLGLTTFADPNGGGLFLRGEDRETNNGGNEPGTPMLPAHGGTENANAPLGTGIAVLTAFGVAYLVGKRRK